MWPCHSANGRARLRFQPRRREGAKEGGREGDKHLSVLMIWTASRYRLHFWVCCYWQHFVWAVWVFGWHTLRREGIPALGRIQECAREQSEERRREDSSSFFSLHLCLHRRFVSERMGAGALTICVSRNLKAGSWLQDSPVSREVWRGGLQNAKWNCFTLCPDGVWVFPWTQVTFYVKKVQTPPFLKSLHALPPWLKH